LKGPPTMGKQRSFDDAPKMTCPQCRGDLLIGTAGLVCPNCPGRIVAVEDKILRQLRRRAPDRVDILKTLGL